MDSPLRSTLSRLSSPLTNQVNNSIDPTLAPYVPGVIAQEKQKQSQFQPLQFVLDLLQRGQYLTANIADEIEKSATKGTPLGQATLNTLKSAFEGLTGARKGDWETLLFGGDIGGTSSEAGARAGWLPDSMKGANMSDPLIRWGGEGSTGLAEGILRPRKLIGLAANIAGDPLTYATFGATTAARATAEKFAKDVLKLTVATMGPEEIAAKLGIKFSEKVGKSAEDVIKVISKEKGSTIGKRFLEDTYNQAYMNALRNPQAKIMEDIAPKLEIAGQRAADNPGLSGLLQTMQTPAMYEKAGTRSFKLLGKDVGASVRQPWAPQQAWETIARRFGDTGTGQKLSDAWYSVMNNGVVGQIRKSFGIRNPYEQMLNITKRRVSDLGISASSLHHSNMVNQVFKEFDQETQDLARNAVIAAESGAEKQGVYGTLSQAGYEGGSARWTPQERQALAGEYDVLEKFKDPTFRASLGIKPEQVEGVRILLEKKAQLDKYFSDAENEIAMKVTGSPAVDDRINYFPQLKVGEGEMGGNTIGRGGIYQASGTQGFTKGKAVTVNERIKHNSQMLDFLMHGPLDEAWKAGGQKGTYEQFVEQFVKDHNLSETTLDLEGAYQLRAIAHAHFMAKYNMIDEFKQFGIPIQDVIKANPSLANSLNTYGEKGLSQLGLYSVTTPGFEGMLFDKPVADVITNAGKLISGDAASKGIVQAFDRFTNLWKGFAVATPGFTFRNVIQNNLTGFMKYGLAWLDPKMFQMSVIGSAYAANPTKYIDILAEKFKMGHPFVESVLNTRVGDSPFTLKELVDWMKQNGTVGSMTQVAKEGVTQKLFKPVRAINDFAENQAKIQSFLTDYSQMAKGTTVSDNIAENLATHKQYLEYADKETKKWFIDYGDLTPFEQKFMKRIVPFYSWVRHNIANQLTGIVTLPETYSLIPKVRNAMTDEEGKFNPSLLPDYMKNVGYYPVGRTAQGTNIMRWANIALEDVNKIPVTFENGNPLRPQFTGGEILQDVFSNAHPLLKTFVEQITGKDTFHRRDIRQYEIASPVFQYLNNAGPVIQFLDGAMRTIGFNNGLGVKIIEKPGGGKEMVMNGKVQRFLDTNVPALRTLDMLISAPEAVAEQFNPAIEQWIEKNTGKKDYYTGLEEIFRVVSRVGGWKFKEVSQDEEAKLKEAELRAKLSVAKSQNQTSNLAYAARMAKARKSNETRNHRMFGSYTR